MNKTGWVAAVLAGAIGLAAQVLPAQQYQVFSWENFEGGGFPPNLRVGHQADPTVMGTVSFAQNIFPNEMRSPLARRNCGNQGLLFTPQGENHTMSVVSPVSLERSRLGSEGRALYQMDVFLPAKGTPFPNTALLAISTEHYQANPKTTHMYRFGVSEKGESVYFSHMNGGAAPVTYLRQNIDEFKLARPGWHRLQIIFRGQDEISCAVDGVPTKFSPLKESSVTRMTPGAFVAATKGVRSASVIDNLSIQWSPTEAPLPESPWAMAARGVPASGAENLFVVNEEVDWLSDPHLAWDTASRENRPILMMFFAPNVQPYRHLLGITPGDNATRDLLRRYVLLRVDANQLQGGTLAGQFRVTQVPSFIVLGSDGNEQRRMTVINNHTAWPEVARFLGS